MNPRDRRRAVGAGLLVLGVLSLVVPALVPVGSEHVHDTRPTTTESRAELEDRGVPVLAYDDLSDRGQAVYREALLTGGVYSVPPGQGIQALEYPDNDPKLVAIERPADAEDLPSPDELRVGPVDEDLPEDEQQRRQDAQRYDLMEVNAGPPSLDSFPQLLRLAVGLLAVLSLGVGGYLSALPAGRPRDAG
jgi:hypothetical protein